MEKQEAEKKLCPFRFGRPQEESQIGELKSIMYGDQHCVTHKCMAWELIEFGAYGKPKKDPDDKHEAQEYVRYDQGYCALIHQEVVPANVVSYMGKPRAH